MESFKNSSHQVIPGSLKMKNKISISVDFETIEKIDESIFKRKFRNRSHAFEYALNKLFEGGEDENEL
jgi:metal-responsive CopG/Arc/MetJ family transcriptional regulator